LIIKLIISVTLSILLASTSYAVNEIDFPKDSNGWSVFTPSVDSRIMYVAEDGNDTTAVVYTQANHPSWSTPFNPGVIQAYSTSGAAYTQVREGYPDWVLFKRGGTFTLTQSTYACIYTKNGRSATEPSLIGAYGVSGLSPVLKAGNKTVFWDINGLHWLAVSGLDFYANQRDPNSPEFLDHTATGEGAGSGLFFGASTQDGLTGVLFEGCKFRHFHSGGHYSCGSVGGFACNGIEHFRCVYYDQHSGPSTGHSAGLGGTGAEISIRECILDHNGWLNQAGTTGDDTVATIFSHNMYLSNLYNSVFEGNISMRSSSIGLKITASNGAASINNVQITNNLFHDNEVGIDIDNNYTVNYRVKNLNVKNNVLINAGASRPTNRTLSWGINANGWEDCQVINNVLVHNNNPLVTNGLGLNFSKLMRNVSVTGNVLYGLKYHEGLIIQGTGAESSTGMSFTGNKIQIPQNSYYAIKAPLLVPGWTFANNIYYSDKTASQLFLHNNVDKSLSEWQALTGDNSTFEQVTFPDPTRSIETYMTSIGETPTLEAFYAKCRAQDRYNWDAKYTAATVNSYIKAGFGMGEYVPPPSGGGTAHRTNGLGSLIFGTGALY